MKRSVVLLAVLMVFGAGFVNAQEGPAAWYQMNGDFKDSSGRGNDLSPLGPESKFAADVQLKAGENTAYVSGDEKNGASGMIRNIDPEKGLTVTGFYFSGTNDFRGIVAGFFDEHKWGAPEYVIDISHGVVNPKMGTHRHGKMLMRLPHNSWSHLAIVLPPKSDGRNEFDVYVNGEKVDSIPAAYAPISGKFNIGIVEGKQASGKMFDEIKVFNRALSADEIKTESVKSGKEPVAAAAPAAASAPSGNVKITIPRRQAPEKAPDIAGTLKLEILDNRNLCLIGNYQDFLVERFKEECGPFLKKLEEPATRVPDWSRAFHYNFGAAEIIKAYRPKISAAYSDPGAVKIYSGDDPVKINATSYWINPVSAGRYFDFGKQDGDREILTRTAEVNHYEFIELVEPLAIGRKYTLINGLGEKIDFSYDGQNFSPAIKVNQVGYDDQAGRKYGYLGVWRGPTLKERVYTEFSGKKFQLIDNKSGKAVFTGDITPRTVKDAEYVNKDGGKGAPFSGEDVYDLDFSAFKTPGEYHIHIPGVGNSWDFAIGPETIGEAFYVRMKGMYHKRCGIAKEPPYTNWPFGECHMTTYVGNFPPNDRHYGVKGSGAGFYNDKGERVGSSAFELISKTAADKVASGVSGGWHDAADYDRRTYHLSAVYDMAGAYFLAPENFSDGQLNIPESGNGIPDLLDEVIWGMDVWRRAQNEKGGVGCWIEASSHPKDHNPNTDKQPYFLALPTRESTAEYAACAAALSGALRKAGADAQSKLFLDSAIKAYAYATDPANSAVQSYEFDRMVKGKPEQVKFTYREGDDVPAVPLAKAALNLYLLTRDAEYLAEFRKYKSEGFDKGVRDMHWARSPFYFAEIITETGDMPEFKDERQIFKTRVRALADERLNELDNNYQYRMPWWPSNHGFVTHMSWGNFQPLNRAKVFAVAYKTLDDAKYRDAALLCNDWQLGANPTGLGMTSGLGKSYPVRFLDLPSYSDGIVEFVPGITPYRNTFGLAPDAYSMAFGLFYNERKDHAFEAEKILLMPDVYSAAEPDYGQFRSALTQVYPILRRFANLEGYTVAASEYTVWETMAPHAAVTGVLLRPGYKPSEELKNRKPSDDLKKLPGYFNLP